MNTPSNYRWGIEFTRCQPVCARKGGGRLQAATIWDLYFLCKREAGDDVRQEFDEVLG